MIVKQLPCNERPRELLINKGVNNLSNSDLLAIILSSGTKDYSVKDLSNVVLSGLNKIQDLKNINYNELLNIKGIGTAKACQLLALVELGKRIFSTYEDIKEIKIKSAFDIYDYYKNLYYEKQEHFFCVYLDSKNKIIKDKLLFVGTINESLVHPRDIYKEAYLVNAVSIICVHNHPSGDVTPSNNDKIITKRLKEIGDELGINVIDHIIIGNNNYYSFADNNYL